MEWEPAPGEPAPAICRKAQLFSKSLLELLHRKNLPGTECPLLAQSRHKLLHCTCLLMGVKSLREVAFAVAIGGKADMAVCVANVCFDPKRTSRHGIKGGFCLGLGIVVNR